MNPILQFAIWWLGSGIFCALVWWGLDICSFCDNFDFNNKGGCVLKGDGVLCLVLGGGVSVLITIIATFAILILYLSLLDLPPSPRKIKKREPEYLAAARTEVDSFYPERVDHKR